MTKNLKLFALMSLVWSVVFFATLHWALFDPDSRGLFIAGAAITYGLGFGLGGYVFGKRDSARNSRLNLGLWYSMTSNIASMLVGSLWVLIFRRDEWPTLVIMAVIFGLISIIAALSSRKSIKGIEKEKLFQ